MTRHSSRTSQARVIDPHALLLCCTKWKTAVFYVEPRKCKTTGI